MRTGAQHIESLKDGRRVFLNGEKVANVTTHPAFRGAIRSVVVKQNVYRNCDFKRTPAMVDAALALPPVE